MGHVHASEVVVVAQPDEEVVEVTEPESVEVDASRMVEEVREKSREEPMVSVVVALLVWRRRVNGRLACARSLDPQGFRKPDEREG